jgi:lipopolysaccharide transport system permease protein
MQAEAVAGSEPLVDRTDAPRVLIRPVGGWRSLDVAELWEYRELIHIFAWRDLKVRYRQTALGVIWVLGQPLITMLLFTVIFNRVARIHADVPVPYNVFVLASLLIWNFFSASCARSANSLIGASFLISKVYFPRLVIPLSGVLVDLFDLAVSALLLIPVMLWAHIAPTVSFFLLPLILLVAVMLTLGAGLWLAALNVEYRDVRVLVPFLLQIGMYATPVVYPLSLLPPSLRPYAIANPMTGVVEAFRAALFGAPILWSALAWSAAAGVLLMLSGAYYFRRMERLFADVI